MDPMRSGDGSLESTLSWLGKTAITLRNTYKVNAKKEIMLEKAKAKGEEPEHILIQRVIPKVKKILEEQIGSYAKMEYAEEEEEEEEGEEEEEEQEEDGDGGEEEEEEQEEDGDGDEEEEEEEEQEEDGDEEEGDIMDYLEDQMQNLLEYCLTGETYVVRPLCKTEHYLRTLFQLQSTSTRVNDLRKLNPDLDQELKVMLKSCKHESSSADEERKGEERFAAYRHTWELVNGNKFEELTSLNSMLFTSCTPGRMPWYAAVKIGLQICSIKVTEISYLEWPLAVYGIIAARDTMDSHRNPLFLRPRGEWQIITQQDPFLRLTGPVRAILCEDPVSFEIQLKVKGRAESEDREFISATLSYNGGSGHHFSTLNVSNQFCKMEFCVERLERSVQATILSVRVIKQGLKPFPHGGQVACSWLPRGCTDIADSPSRQVVLLDSVDGKMVDEHGYIDLERRVVSVELNGTLKVYIKAYSSCGDISRHVQFIAKKCNFSKERIVFGDMEVEVTVAWSLLVNDDESILTSSYVDPFGMCPPLHPSLLREMDGYV